MITKKDLENYNLIQREIKRIERKLEYYKLHPLTSEHGVVTGSMKSFPYAEKHFVLSAPNVKSDRERKKQVQQLTFTLIQRKQELEELKFAIDVAIEEIDDMELRQIVQMKYIDEMKDSDIADELGYERSSITKKLLAFTQFTLI